MIVLPFVLFFPFLLVSSLVRKSTWIIIYLGSFFPTAYCLLLCLLRRKKEQEIYHERLENISEIFEGVSNRPLQSSKNPHFQNEARCTTFLVKKSFICMRMKNDFHSKRWAATLLSQWKRESIIINKTALILIV